MTSPLGVSCPRRAVSSRDRQRTSPSRSGRGDCTPRSFKRQAGRTEAPEGRAGDWGLGAVTAGGG